MIDREHELSVARQAKLLGFSRGTVYYLPRPVPDDYPMVAPAYAVKRAMLARASGLGRKQRVD